MYHEFRVGMLSVLEPRRRAIIGLMMMVSSFSIGYSTVTKTALGYIFLYVTEFFVPRVQGNKITIILGVLLPHLVSFDIFRYLMESFVYSGNASFNWFHNLRNCELHVINNLQKKMQQNISEIRDKNRFKKKRYNI